MKGSISEEALLKYNQLVAEKQGLDFAEGDSYDFTTCIRPDGSSYGTSGKCRKGTEGEAKAREESKGEFGSFDKLSQDQRDKRIKQQGDLVRDLKKGGNPEWRSERDRLDRMLDKDKEVVKGPIAPAPPKSAMTKKDPVASVLRSQQELRDFNKRENERLAEMIKAGKVKGVTSADLDRIKANRNRG